ncbi:MAG: hypothetical protein SNJ75_01210 [Gemmataceae bacterium]
MSILDACQNITKKWLGDFPFQPVRLDPEFALVQSPRMTLEAFGLQNHVAEVRLVRIRGKSANVFNCLIFPHSPQTTPVFVAELLATGGQLRLAFVDVQTPGLADTQPTRLKTAELARRYGAWNHSEPAPRWAMTYSSGSPAYLRPTTPMELPMTELYSDYLRVWTELAQPGVPSSSSELDAFKQHHRSESPVSEYLSRVFGANWTFRFLNGFLYR